MTACGRIGFDGLARSLDGGVDSGTDAPAACTGFSAWGAPTNVTALNSTALEWGPHMSHDKLTLYFASRRGGSSDQMYQAVRVSETSPWQPPTLVVFTPSIGAAEDPSDSLEGLELFWGSGVQYATRATTFDTWTPLGGAGITGTGFSIEGGPDLSADGLTIMFTGTLATDQLWHSYQATRTTVGAAWSSATPMPLTQTSDGEGFGSFSGDQLDLVYSTETTARLHEATRASSSAAFGNATNIAELDDASSAADPDLSDDRLTLWFASTRAGGLGDYDLWFSTRTCL